MKLTSQQMEELYPILKKFAYFSFRRAYSFLTNYEAETLAHDYTVRFFYSKSLAKTYSEDKSRGIKAYFSSYISKCLMSYYRELKQERKLIPIDACLFRSDMPHLDPFVAVEFQDYLDSLYDFLDKVYVTIKGEPLACRLVLKAIVIQVFDKQLWGGELSRRRLRKQLNINDKQVQKALNKLREVLNARRAEGLI